MTKPKVHVISNASDENKDALRDILDRLAGTPLERSGDIVLIYGGVQYVVSDQAGHAGHAAVVRPGGERIVEPPYRSDIVAEIASRAWDLAQQQPSGVEFTLKDLVSGQRADLSAVEQRNAGRNFRLIAGDDLSAGFDQWKTSDNEWHYRRRQS